MLIGANYSSKVFANAAKKEEVENIKNEIKENISKFEIGEEVIEREVPIYIEKQKSVTLSFLGDCLLGSDLRYGTWGSFVQVFQNEGPAYFFKNVLPILKSDDITVANLENPLTNKEKKVSKEFVFKGEPQYTSILNEGSIDAVNIENNHIKDYYDVGYEDTKENLKNEGISFFGDKINYIREVNGIKVGFLGYKAWNENNETKNKILKGITELKEKEADIIVVSFHWGDESTNYPNDIQKNLAKYTIDNGADIIIGHHPHVMQGIEIYKDKPIIYSLGNFSFGGNRNPKNKDTFIYQQTFVFEDGNKKVDNSKIIPCSVSSVMDKNDFKPTPLSGKDADRVLNSMLEYSKSMNSEQFIKESFSVFE